MSDNNKPNLRWSSFGAMRVNAEFNPSKSDVVDQIKNKSAELINLIHTLVEAQERSEKARCVNIAINHIETAAMYAVKAYFKED